MFILATLQHHILGKTDTHVLVISHSIESASLIEKLYKRFSKDLPTLNIELFTDLPEAIKSRDQTLETTARITIGTCDCILELIKAPERFKNVQHLILNLSGDMVDRLGLF